MVCNGLSLLTGRLPCKPRFNTLLRPECFFPHPSVNCRFSEVYVPELEDRLDLKRVVDGYIAGVSLETDNLAFTAVDLYLWARGLAGESLSDGAGQRPRYSLR